MGDGASRNDGVRERNFQARIGDSLRVKRHHGGNVVRLGKVGLARAKRRPWREGSRTEMGARSKGRRHKTKGFTANRAVLRAKKIGAKPMASFFTSWIDTLNGGARHQGHSALPQWLPAQRMSVSPHGSKEMCERTGRTRGLLRADESVSTGKRRKRWEFILRLWKKQSKNCGSRGEAIHSTGRKQLAVWKPEKRSNSGMD